jgi:hypothetical protein
MLGKESSATCLKSLESIKKQGGIYNIGKTIIISRLSSIVSTLFCI